MEYLLVFLGFLFSLFISVAHYRNSAIYSFYCVSLLSSLTVLGASNLNLLLVVVSYFMVYLAKGGRASRGDYFVFIFVSGLLLAIGLLPTIHGYYYWGAVGKWGKTVLVVAPMFIVLRDRRFDCCGFMMSFLIANIMLGSLCLYFLDGDDGFYGVSRFSGFLFDSNYFALLALLGYVFSDTFYFRDARSLKVISVFCVFSSQSVTFTSLLFVYIVLRWSKFVIGNNRIVIFIPLLVGVLYLFFLKFFLSGFMFDVMPDYNVNPVALKVNSLIFRLRPQIEAISLMSASPNLYLTGYGSGLSAFLFGKTLHNFYVQVFFDNGILFFAVLNLTLGWLMYRQRVPLFIVFVFVFSSLLFDPVFMFVLTFAVLLHSNGLRR